MNEEGRQGFLNAVARLGRSPLSVSVTSPGLVRASLLISALDVDDAGCKIAVGASR